MLRRPHLHPHDNAKEESDITARIGGTSRLDETGSIASSAASSVTTTSAFDFVSDSARDVFPNDDKKNRVLSKIHQCMEEECIGSIEQLQFLEASEFKSLGFPLGLTTIIRRRLSQRGESEQTQQPPQQQQVQPTSSHTPLQQHSPNSRQDTDSDDDDQESTGASFFADGSVHSSMSNNGTADKNPKKTSIFWQRALFLWRTTRWRDWCIPVDHQSAFKKATMFAMEGQADFKEYTLRHAEMWMVISSLFLGATMTCWSLLPDTFGTEDLREDTTLAYLSTAANSFMVFTTQMNVGAISAHAVTFTVAGTVHEKNFKSFFATAGIYMVMCGETFFLISLYFFFASVFLLTYLRIEIVHRRHDLALSALWPMAANFITTCVCLFYMFCNINFVSRTAMHTGLMLDPSIPQSKGREEFASSHHEEDPHRQEQNPGQPKAPTREPTKERDWFGLDEEIVVSCQQDQSTSHDDIEYDLVKKTLRKSIAGEKELFNELVRCSTSTR